MSAGRAGGTLDACPVTCSSTATSRTSAASSSPSFKGHEEPAPPPADPRPRAAPAATRSGGRSRPTSEADALELLPYYVAERTTVSRVSEVEIP